MIKEPRYKICSEGDIPQILKIYNQSYIEHYLYLWTDHGENYMKTNFTKEKILSEMNEDDTQFFLIYHEELPVGILKLNNNKAIDKTRDTNYLEIERIYFLKEASGKGLGKSTIKMVEHLATNENKKVIWLKAMKSGDAVKFYEKQGFVVTDQIDLSYPNVKDEFKRMVLMQLPLN
ncbi:GNAT family N-acetyltransferase [Flavobacterium sp. ov086]|uniref:GNAT family N-acetyltransferase n=1 Tax=Flavobacterium sp. ov086 TaxID=1761785 RepID=UPI000B63F6BF|nr:GNAT family N-acetyltransferase [Flavobacterium sp. ov086]SNR41768.1 Ribosomal protein S18 acetylase RimI [Flavobacterium sp. ov086]